MVSKKLKSSPQRRFTSVFDLEKPGGCHNYDLRFPRASSVYGHRVQVGSLKEKA
jgi:hypothetical protein